MKCLKKICKIRKVLLIGSFKTDRTVSKTQCHAVVIKPKNWKFGGCSEQQQCRIFKYQIDLKLKKTEWFSRRDYGELAITKFD